MLTSIKVGILGTAGILLTVGIYELRLSWMRVDLSEAGKVNAELHGKIQKQNHGIQTLELEGNIASDKAEQRALREIGDADRRRKLLPVGTGHQAMNQWMAEVFT